MCWTVRLKWNSKSGCGGEKFKIKGKFVIEQEYPTERDTLVLDCIRLVSL